MRLLLAGFGVLLVTACGWMPSPGAHPIGSEAAGPSAATAPVSTPHACTAGRDTPTDVAHEPDWRSHGDFEQWTTADGCLVRVDVLTSRPGPQHCGYESARVLITGTPLGTPSARDSDSISYIRDPDGVFRSSRLVEEFSADTDLPADAKDTGYRLGAVQLWLTETNDAAYLVDGDTIERWPRGEDVPCA